MTPARRSRSARVKPASFGNWILAETRSPIPPRRYIQGMLLRIALPCLILSAILPAPGAMPAFAFRPISPPGIQFYRETLLPADIDHDGDMDFYSGGGRGNPTWWFENAGDHWIRRIVSDSNVADVGAALLDVDGDGWVDKVSASFWYRNPGFPKPGTESHSLADPAKEKPFAACRYGDIDYVHDIYTADMDGDGHPDILTIDYDGIRWFKVERDSVCRPWVEHKINGRTLDPQQHGGIAAGDLDGDGDMDVARLDRWFENRDGIGTVWLEHKNIDFGAYWSEGWGLSGRALIRDVDGDGTQDLIETECDIPNGRVAWFANIGGKGLAWQRHIIKDSTDGQDFHSLAWADFDGDGDSDLFSSGGPNSAGTPRAWIWENLDGKGGAWSEHIVNIGKREHEATAVDMDGDGDIDILVKTWGDGEQYYLENELVPNNGTGVSIRRTRERNSSGAEKGSRHSDGRRSGSGWKKRFHLGGKESNADGRRTSSVR